MSESTIKPVIILPKGEVSAEDIQQLRDNGICAIEAENPGEVRFMESQASNSNTSYLRADILDSWAKMLMQREPIERPSPPEEVKHGRRSRA